MQPALKPQNLNFSSGPCAKRPGYDVSKLQLDTLGRSHRSALGNKALGLGQGKLGKYVCDFSEPLLLNHAKVISMPHIGASTEKSEDNCAVMAADQLIDYLKSGNTSGVLGHVLSVLADQKVNVIDMMNMSRGELAFNIIDVESLHDAGDLAPV
jgi:hypothetical protein